MANHTNDGLSVEWSDCNYDWEGEGEGARPPKLFLSACVEDVYGERWAGLSGVSLDSMHDPYVAVVEAELLDEARYAMSDKTELARRATYRLAKGVAWARRYRLDDANVRGAFEAAIQQTTLKSPSPGPHVASSASPTGANR